VKRAIRPARKRLADLPGSLGERFAAVLVDVNAANDAIAPLRHARQVISGAPAGSVGRWAIEKGAHAALRLGFRLLEGWNSRKQEATCAHPGYSLACAGYTARS